MARPLCIPGRSAIREAMAMSVDDIAAVVAALSPARRTLVAALVRELETAEVVEGLGAPPQDGDMPPAPQAVAPVPEPESRPAPPAGRARGKAARDAAIVTAYTVYKASPREIAAEHGVTAERVRQILRANGVDLPHGGRRQRARSPLTDSIAAVKARRASVLAALRAGRAVQDVAREMDMTPEAVRRIGRAEGVLPSAYGKKWTQPAVPPATPDGEADISMRDLHRRGYVVVPLDDGASWRIERVTVDRAGLLAAAARVADGRTALTEAQMMAVAQRAGSACASAAGSRKPRRRPMDQRHSKNPDRDRAIIAAHRDGATMSDLRERFGLSRDRIQMILDRGEEALS